MQLRILAGKGDSERMEYLLSKGVPVPMGDMGLLGVAANLGHEATVRVLRRYPPFDGNWSLQTLAGIAIMDTEAFVQLLRDTVAVRHEPYHCYGSVYAIDDFKEWHGALADGATEFRPTAVRTSWPPDLAGGAASYLACAAEVALGAPTVHKMWEAVGRQRRVEAKMLAPYNWKKLRAHCRARTIAFYWLGVAQVTQCAAEGAGRRADAAAYVEDGFA